jgi:DNA polymerase type B, organellar and viral
MEPDFRLDRMSTKLADIARRQKELKAARDARYNASQRGKEVRAKYNVNRTDKDRHPTRKRKQETRPFVVWDGEQPRDTGYSLFGNSEGGEICHPHLGTQECLDLIIETEIEIPDAIHCVYGGDFDISWILKDLTWRQLGRLKNYNNTAWNGYEITHVPHKWWSVTWGKYTAKVYDVVSFFGSGLVPALEDWKIGPFAEASGLVIPDDVKMPTLAEMDNMSEVQIVATFKKLRGEFLWRDIQQQRRYMHLELKYTKQMMERLRDIFLQAGYLPKSWHGPGALSRQACQRHKVNTAMAQCPLPVREAARFAYFGGRFTQHLAGHLKTPVYVRDRNSAYPFAATFLPNLARGKWRFENEPVRIRQALEENKFAVFNLEFWDRPPPPPRAEYIRRIVWEVFPLPMRSPDHAGIMYPEHVKGWYWTPEARMVMNDPRTTFIGCWVFDEDDPTDRPFEWMREYYRRRLLLKRIGDPAEYTFKIIINGAYGQLAQRVGWDKVKRKPPPSHQLEWAGYITSHCRTAMWEMAQRVGMENVVSIDTDGITTLAPIPAKDGEIGEELGQYKDEVYEDGVFWQTGVYGLKKDGKWIKAKTRGIPKGQYKPERLIQLCADGAREFTIDQSQFIGYGLAFNGRFDEHNKWVTVPQTYLFGGSGDMVHWNRSCHITCTNVHRLRHGARLPNESLTIPFESAPHFLPWEDNSEGICARYAEEDDITFYYIGSDDI